LKKIQYTGEQIQKIIELLDLIELKGIKNWGVMNSIISILDKGETVSLDDTIKLTKEDKGKDDLIDKKNEVR